MGNHKKIQTYRGENMNVNEQLIKVRVNNFNKNTLNLWNIM